MTTKEIKKSTLSIFVKLQKLKNDGNEFLKDYTDEQIEEAVIHYKNFLTLYSKYIDQNLVATEEIAFVWEVHSSMVSYTKYCLNRFGETLERKIVGKFRKKERKMLKKDFLATQDLYNTEFGSTYKGEMSFCSTRENEYIVESVQTFF